MVVAARALYPDRPGALDLPAWDIGRRWCRPAAPDCPACPLNRACPRYAAFGSLVFAVAGEYTAAADPPGQIRFERNPVFHVEMYRSATSGGWECADVQPKCLVQSDPDEPFEDSVHVDEEDTGILTACTSLKPGGADDEPGESDGRPVPLV